MKKFLDEANVHNKDLFRSFSE